MKLTNVVTVMSDVSLTSVLTPTIVETDVCCAFDECGDSEELRDSDKCCKCYKRYDPKECCDSDQC